MLVNLDLSTITERAFLQVCRREGTTPEDVLEAAARRAIHGYLLAITEDSMPGGRDRRERRRELFAQFHEGIGVRTWPLTEDGVPGSLEEAEGVAREHGREQAAQFERAMKCARHSRR